MTSSSRSRRCSILGDARALRRHRRAAARGEALLGLRADEGFDRDARRQRDTRAAAISPSFSAAMQRRAISTVLASASGTSANSSRHLLGRAQVLLPRCIGAGGPGPRAARRRRCRRALRATRNRPRARKRTSLVATTGTPRLVAERHGRGDVRLLVGPAEPLQLEVVAVAEQLLPVRAPAQRSRLAAVDERAADVAFGRAGQRDQAGGVCGVSQAGRSAARPCSWPSRQARVTRCVTF